MSDPLFDGMHEDLFDQFGQDGTIQRGAAAPVPVRVVVDEGVQRLGEYGQVVGRVTVVSFLVAQFRPRQADVVNVAGWSKPVASIDADDGFVAKVVLHG